MCRKYLNHNGKNLNVSFEFKLVNISGGYITLQNVVSKW